MLTIRDLAKSHLVGVAAMVAGLLLVWLPAINGLPIAGYTAIALILLGAVLVMPRLAAACLDRLPVPRQAPAAIAVAQLKATPRQAAISVAAIVISVSLMVSMLIMVSSFRVHSKRGSSACCRRTFICARCVAARPAS